MEPPSAPGSLPSLLPSPAKSSHAPAFRSEASIPLFLPQGQTNALFTITHPSFPKAVPRTFSSLPSDSCFPSPQLGYRLALGPWTLCFLRFPKPHVRVKSLSRGCSSPLWTRGVAADVTPALLLFSWPLSFGSRLLRVGGPHLPSKYFGSILPACKSWL